MVYKAINRSISYARKKNVSFQVLRSVGKCFGDCRRSAVKKCKKQNLIFENVLTNCFALQDIPSGFEKAMGNSKQRGDMVKIFNCFPEPF